MSKIDDMSISDVSEELKQEIIDWGKKFNINEESMLHLLELSLEDGGLDYLNWQIDHFEEWCKHDPKWKEDPVRRAHILLPICQYPSRQLDYERRDPDNNGRLKEEFMTFKI